MNRILRVMGLLVILLYIIVGSSLVFTPFMEHMLKGQLRTITGILCIVYGLFRAVRYFVSRNQDSDS